MTKFSANLGFLWRDLPLPDAIRAAKNAGFDAVECHWPYDIPPAEIVSALAETGLKMLSLNTAPGDEGGFGLAAIPGRETEARAAIDQAITYASAIATPNIHVMAGGGEGQTAHNIFVENLRYACTQAMPFGITILIEPLNSGDAPGYFLNTSRQAVQIIEEVDLPNLKMMFDCYHMQIIEGNVSRRLTELLPLTGHIQFASVPARAEPDGGELSYSHVFALIKDLGYRAPLGAEYRPQNGVENGLGWMKSLRQ